MPSDSFGNIMCVLQLLFYSILIFSFLILLKYTSADSLLIQYVLYIAFCTGVRILQSSALL